MALRASHVLFVLGLSCGQGSVRAVDDVPPDPALLEFLGEWDDGEGHVLDWEMLDGGDDTPPAADTDAAP